MAAEIPIHPNSIPENDRAVVDLLRTHGSMTVGQLVESLGVTATAIRQRLTRLMGSGMIQRSQAPDGRGRPRHRYALTERGRNAIGSNLNDLAKVLWEEVQQIEDDETKRKLIAGVVRRLAAKYEGAASSNTTDQKLEAFTRVFAEKQIPIEYTQSSSGLPIITVSGCPYPDLAQDNREICDMEKQLMAKLVGGPVSLCRCQQDGDDCCSFQALGVETSE